MRLLCAGHKRQVHQAAGLPGNCPHSFPCHRLPFRLLSSLLCCWLTPVAYAALAHTYCHQYWSAYPAAWSATLPTADLGAVQLPSVNTAITGCVWFHLVTATLMLTISCFTCASKRVYLQQFKTMTEHRKTEVWVGGGGGEAVKQSLPKTGLGSGNKELGPDQLDTRRRTQHTKGGVCHAEHTVPGPHPIILGQATHC